MGDCLGFCQRRGNTSCGNSDNRLAYRTHFLAASFLSEHSNRRQVPGAAGAGHDFRRRPDSLLQGVENQDDPLRGQPRPD